MIFSFLLSNQLVGAVRFELTTTGTPCRYATRLRYAPWGEIISERLRAAHARSSSITPLISRRSWLSVPRPARADLDGSATSSSSRLRAPLMVKP